ncbi:hypothetical protein ABKV19_014598 [Rosa sericea]
MTVLPLRFRKGLCVRETSIDCSYQAVRYNGDESIDRIDQALTYKGCWGGKEKRRDSRIKIVVGFGGRVCVCFRSGGFENFDRVWGIIFSRKKVSSRKSNCQEKSFLRPQVYCGGIRKTEVKIADCGYIESNSLFTAGVETRERYTLLNFGTCFC